MKKIVKENLQLKHFTADHKEAMQAMEERNAQLEKIPSMLVIGEKEVKTNSVSVRKRDDGDFGSMPIEQLLKVLHKEGI